MTEPFEWPQYLGHANELAQRPEEGMQRLAIHAAYYSAYNVARIYVEYVLKIASPKVGDTHAFVWDSIAKPNSTIGRLGRNLRNIRNNADYDDPFPGKLPLQVQNALKWAAEIIAALPIDD